jgi:cytochrome P450
MSKWFNLYSFDVMGDLGFGRSFNMLESGETHWAIKLLNEGMDPMGFGFPPWFFRVLIEIPGLTKGYHQFIGFCSQQLENRMKMGKMENPDITSTLIEHFRATEAREDSLPLIQGDSRLIIVAGSDTTAATLVHLFYHLAKEPALVEKLREELTPLIGQDGLINNQKIKDAQFLNGAINETLRLNPPVPSGVFRKTPEEGVYIGNTFIAGNTVIQIPNYALGHG